MKRAAIYVRVSTERQAGEEKASPEQQEKGCRALCTTKGYEVVGVYRDIESGTRSNRPQFLRMLKDFDSDSFDVLVVWRDDRLYRGITTATIEIRDRASRKSNPLVVEVVNGVFDVRTMEILAFAAGIENKARVERRAMGMAKRMEKGKVVLSNCIYGYDYSKVTGHLTVNEVEAHWVRQIWQWYAEGLSRFQIRNRLIAAGAPQKATATTPRKHPWNLRVIDGIVQRTEYFSGEFFHRLDGAEYVASIPKLVDEQTYLAVVERRAQWKQFPAGNMKASVLLAGRIYCQSCGTKMGLQRQKPRDKVYTRYTCYCVQHRTATPNCCGSINQVVADDEVWRRVWTAISEPGMLEQALKERVAQLEAELGVQETSMATLEQQLNDLLAERQKVVSWGLRGIINENDMEVQLAQLSAQEKVLRQELSAKRKVSSGAGVRHNLEMVEAIRKEIMYGRLAVSSKAIGGFADVQFEWKKRIVDLLVSKVVVLHDKSIEVHLEIDPRKVGATLGRIGEEFGDDDDEGEDGSEDGAYISKKLLQEGASLIYTVFQVVLKM